MAFVSSHALGGGSERYLELLLDNLEPGWIASVAVLQEGPFVERLRESGRPVDVVPTPERAGMLAAALPLRRALVRARPQVVHANGVKAALAAALATAGTRLPVLWLKHDFSWDGPLARMLAWRCRRVVAVSGAITTTFGPRLQHKVEVVPNGIPDLARDPEGSAAVADLVGEDGPVVLHVGRLHPAKGQLELVEAAPEVLRHRPDARFLMVGGQDPTQLAYGRTVRTRVAELGLQRAVTFAGHRDDALRLMSGADVMVLSSVPDERGAGKEACPFALLEAMSVQLPVVAYAAGGIPEVLGDCGRLVPEGDRASLAQAVADLLECGPERVRAATCARDRVRRRHDLEATVAAMRVAYRETAA